jgi:hypothetical protein
MRLRPAFLLASLLLPIVTACGPEVGGSGGSGGGENACEDFRPPDTPPWTPVKVRFRNEGSQALFLSAGQGCAGDPAFALESGGQELRWQLGGCGLTCADLQENGCACAADCALPQVFRVEPGGFHEVTWSGAHFVDAAMPASCFADPGCAGSCPREEEAPHGTISIRGVLWDSATGCTLSSCSCTPDANGSCQVDGPAMVDGQSIEDSVAIAYPGSALAELSFGAP